MNNSSRLLLDLWNVIEDHVAKSQRQHVAMAVLRAFNDYGFEYSEFVHAADEDNYLEAALSSLDDDDDSLDGELTDWGREE